MSRIREWVVEFGDCQEAVVRHGESAEAVSYPDDLGCPATRARPIGEVRLRSCPWVKNGELRVELAE